MMRHSSALHDDLCHMYIQCVLMLDCLMAMVAKHYYLHPLQFHVYIPFQCLMIINIVIIIIFAALLVQWILSLMYCLSIIIAR